jgi:hypothetical protein
MSSNRLDLASRERFRTRLGLVLILIFAVNTVFALPPLQLLDPLWQLRMAGLLLATAPFALLGCALISLAPPPGRDTQKSAGQILRQLQRLAPIAALGFFLLIPLQLHAAWSQLRSADVETQKTLRAIQRRVDGVQKAASAADLSQLAQGLPADWQPRAGESLEVNRQRLLARAEPELARLKVQSGERQQQTIQKVLKDVVRDSLIAFLYGYAFRGLSRDSAHPMNLAR